MLLCRKNNKAGVNVTARAPTCVDVARVAVKNVPNQVLQLGILGIRQQHLQVG